MSRRENLRICKDASRSSPQVFRRQERKLHETALHDTRFGRSGYPFASPRRASGRLMARSAATLRVIKPRYHTDAIVKKRRLASRREYGTVRSLTRRDSSRRSPRLLSRWRSRVFGRPSRIQESIVAQPIAQSAFALSSTLRPTMNSLSSTLLPPVAVVVFVRARALRGETVATPRTVKLPTYAPRSRLSTKLAADSRQDGEKRRQGRRRREIRSERERERE